MQREPIEELHDLLFEQAKVAEKITGVTAALGHIRRGLSTALAQQYLHTPRGR
jgi:hypothetical protein